MLLNFLHMKCIFIGPWFLSARYVNTPVQIIFKGVVSIRNLIHLREIFFDVTPSHMTIHAGLGLISICTPRDWTNEILLGHKELFKRTIHRWGMVLVYRNFWYLYDFYQSPREYMTYKINTLSKILFYLEIYNAWFGPIFTYVTCNLCGVDQKFKTP